MNVILIVLAIFFTSVYFYGIVNKNFNKTALTISRIFVGLVFLFSGFVKSVDPLGSTYKFTDYFEAFGMPGLAKYAFGLAIILSSVEFVIGFMLFFNVKTRLANTLAFLFMIFFTPLTFYLAIKNPVSDCGCFGDALIITNWQTFWKNIIILSAVLFIFFNKKQLKPYFNKYKETALILLPSVLIIMFNIYNYQHLPVIDFRPYKIGNNIKVLTKTYDELSENIPEEKAILDKIPKDKAYDRYKTTYIYEKNGVKKEFDSIPDSTWKWVKTNNVLISEGYHPPIHDFSISNEKEGDITMQVLNDTNPVLLIISYRLKDANLSGIFSAYKFAEKAKKKGIKSYFLTASLQEDIDRLKDTLKRTFGKVESSPHYIYYYEKDGNIESFKQNNLPDTTIWHFIDKELVNDSDENNVFDFYETDGTTLKTIIRANPGVLLIKNGQVLNKWHYHDLDESFFDKF